MQIYRYNEYVAINPPEGPTFYLTEREAGMLWRAVRETTMDIACGVPFSQSKVSTVTVDCSGIKGGS